MNKGKYWYVFLKTSPDYVRCLGGIQDDRPFSKEPPVLLATLNKTFPGDGHNIPAARFDSVKNNYAPGLDVAGIPSLSKTSRIYLEISLSRYELIANASSGARLVVEVKTPDEKTGYTYSVRMNDYPADVCCQWRSYDYTFDMPAISSPADRIHFSIQDSAANKFCIGHFQARLWGIKQ
jgi:hypothetical protein